MFSNGYDDMQRKISFDRVCFSRAMIACHVRRCPTVCVVKRLCMHATLDVVRPCVLSKNHDGMPRRTSSRQSVLSKGYDVMPRPTFYDRMYYPRAMVGCHVQRYSTVCSIYGLELHVMPDIIRPCVMSKGHDISHTPRHPTVCVVQRI